ncbi:MAG: rhomboid family intramembrane serine protease [Cellvibrionaceae bacterium]
MLRTICPSCNTKSLQAFSIEAHEVERCDICHGLWFDEPELMAYIEQHADDKLSSFELINDDNFKGKGSRQCHDCNKPMMRHQLLEGYKIDIDACHSCNTFWIDPEEINHVQHSRDLKASLAKINQGFTWRSWFFEFFLRMPVEYNIQPKKIPWVTYIFIAINILLFSVRLVSPTAGVWTINTLSVLYPIVDYSQLAISLLSAQFMHGDLMHLLGNIYFLWIIGDNVEDSLGKLRFALLYILCGIVGFLLELYLTFIFDREIILLGASAAVSGLFGMYLIWFRHAKLSIMLVFYQFRLPAFWFFGLWLITNISGLFASDLGIAYGAHLGGFAAGILVALIYKNKVYDNNTLLRLLNTKAPVINSAHQK